MKVQNLNASSRKTRNLIKEAFVELLQEKKELGNITVTELVKRADITRSSFYTHYDNIYDVAQELQDETLAVLMEDTEDLHSIQDVYNYIDKITCYLKEHEDIYSKILASNEPLIFAERLTKLITKKLYDTFKNNQQNDLLLNVTFFTEGSIILIIKYFKKEFDYSLDDINKYMKRLFKKIFL